MYIYIHIYICKYKYMYIRTHMYTWMYTSTYLHVHIRVKIPCRNYTIFLHVKWFSFFIQQTTSTDALFFSIKTYNWWLVNQNRTRKKKDIKKKWDLQKKPPYGSACVLPLIYDQWLICCNRPAREATQWVCVSVPLWHDKSWFTERDLQDKLFYGSEFHQIYN